ncbi:MAG: hypothetical protein SFV32_01510 [Opitutaceae bacterium]|nr:hypothetical protein [Opitutaceae bacterium]
MKKPPLRDTEEAFVPEAPSTTNDALLDSLPEEMRDPSSGTDMGAADAARNDLSRQNESEGGFDVRRLVESGVDQADTDLEEKARRLKKDV